jgi:hypothetical protein
MLNVFAGHVILCVGKVLFKKMLLLESRDGQTWKDHMCNCALCHLLHDDGQVDLFLTIIPIKLFCMLYGQS